MTTPLRHGERIGVHGRETDIKSTIKLNICLVLFISLSCCPPSVSFRLTSPRLLFLPPLFPSPSFTPTPLFLTSSPYAPSLSPLLSFKTLCLVRSHKEIIYSCPPVRVRINMPAEHINLSHGYRHWLVKLSSDSLQQDDHRMPVAWRIRTVVTISNGGSNVLLCSNLLYCIHSTVSWMGQWYTQWEQ